MLLSNACREAGLSDLQTHMLVETAKMCGLGAHAYVRGRVPVAHEIATAKGAVGNLAAFADIDAEMGDLGRARDALEEAVRVRYAAGPQEELRAARNAHHAAAHREVESYAWAAMRAADLRDAIRPTVDAPAAHRRVLEELSGGRLPAPSASALAELRDARPVHNFFLSVTDLCELRGLDAPEVVMALGGRDVVSAESAIEENIRERENDIEYALMQGTVGAGVLDALQFALRAIKLEAALLDAREAAIGDNAYGMTFEYDDS